VAEPPAAGFRLVAGDDGPRQSGPNDCAPTALTTARMLTDSVLAQWIRTGDPGGRAFPAGASPEARLTAYGRLVHARTNAATGPGGRWQAPWPQALGTPPWGVCRELEAIARPAGTAYRAVWVRGLAPQRVRQLLERLAAGIGAQRPGLLYVGSAVLPRHVALLVPDPGPAGGLLVHDPGAGTVAALDPGALADGRCRIGGWSWPWWLVGPVEPTGR